MKNGLVLSNSDYLILDNSRPGSLYWSKHISHPSDYEARLKEEPAFDDLSPMEISLIEEIFKAYGVFNSRQLVDILHELPE